MFPAARRRIERQDWPRFVVLAALWMAIPFLLYPIAESTVSSSITGMINGGLPVVSAVVTAIWMRRAPSVFRMVAVLVGFAGIAVISITSVDEGTSADLKGIAAAGRRAALLRARRQHRPTDVCRSTDRWRRCCGWLSSPACCRCRTECSAWCAAGSTSRRSERCSCSVRWAPGSRSRCTASCWRAGTVRGMIGIFFTPIVGTILGVAVRGDSLHAWAILGMSIVIVGAVMVSRPEPVDGVRRRGVVLLPEGLLEVSDQVGG